MGSHDTLRILREQIEKLRKEIERLEEENRRLKEEIKERTKRRRLRKILKSIKQRYPATDFIPDFKRTSETYRRKKNGQKKGHKGYTSKIPKCVDVVKPFKIEKCLYCGNELSEIQEIRKRYVEDIPEISNTIITEFQIERRYCRHCKKMVEPEIPDALPNARFGLRLVLLVVFLKKIGLTLPVKKITFLIKTQYNLSISKGEIIKILNKLQKHLVHVIKN